MSKHLIQLVNNEKNRDVKHARRKVRRRGGGLLSTESEVALALGENERTIRSWYHRHIIPGLRLGHRTVRFKLPDVLDALSKREIKVAGRK